MGRCSRHRAPGLVTRQQIAVDANALGIEPGDILMLHAAVGEIGWIVGGPDQVLAGLFDVLWDRGTLMMYAGWDGSPYDVTLGMPELPPQLAALWPAFDPETSRAVREWGVLAEYLRTWPGARRSAHPDSSFVAVGERAEELVAGHPLQYGMGPGSPLDKLCDAGGKVLLLGAPLSTLTLLHHAEHLADVPEKDVVQYWAPILQGGEKAWVRIEEFNTGGEGCLPWFGATDLFEAIAHDHVQEGGGRVGHVGGAKCYLFDAANLVQHAVRWIEERLAGVEPVDDLTDVRPAGPADHRALVAMLRELEEEITGVAISESRAATRVDELLESGDRRVFVAATPTDDVGMIVASVLSPPRGALDHAYVSPNHRRRGVLRELEMEATTCLLERGCSSVELHVGAENTSAREAWLALGYHPTLEFMARPLG